jgi:hypothetical protein
MPECFLPAQQAQETPHSIVPATAIIRNGRIIATAALVERAVVAATASVEGRVVAATSCVVVDGAVVSAASCGGGVDRGVVAAATHFGFQGVDGVGEEGNEGRSNCCLRGGRTVGGDGLRQVLGNFEREGCFGRVWTERD